MDHVLKFSKQDILIMRCKWKQPLQSGQQKMAIPKK